MDITRRLAIAALAVPLAATVLVSCTTATPSAPLGGSSSPAPASAAGSGSLAPASSAASPSGPASSAKLGPLVIAWQGAPGPATPDAGNWYAMAGGFGTSWTKLGDLYVMPLDTEGYDAGAMAGPQIWLSTDLVHWRNANVPHTADQLLSVSAATLGGPGLVAVGDDWKGDSPVPVTWTSVDGETWKQVLESDTGLTAGQLWLLHATANGNVSYADGAVDVTHFQGKPIEPDSYSALVESNGVLTAFVDPDDADHPVQVWQSGGTADWHQVGTIERSNGSSVQNAVQGAHGWFASGCDPDCATQTGWSSADGIAWQPVPVPIGDSVNALIADRSGFIAVGERITGTSCAVGESEIFGETWTSSDGRTWRQMPDDAQFDHASIHVLVRRDRTLYGLGIHWTADDSAMSTIWSAGLPADSADSGAAPSPTPASSAPPGECGD